MNCYVYLAIYVHHKWILSTKYNVELIILQLYEALAETCFS